jgi:prepilin-type processing-associated H-X9-DG protein
MGQQITVPCPQCAAAVVVRGGPGQLLRCAACRKVFPAPATAPPEAVAEASVSPQLPPRPIRNPPQPPSPSAQPVAYTPPRYNFRTPRPGLNVAALVCGLLFFIPPVALIAVILGIIGIVKTAGTRGRGRGFAITGLVLGLVGLALFAAIAPVAIARGRESANRVRCASNLRQIGQAMLMYANENRGAYPPTLGELLLTQDIVSACFVCPSTSHAPAPTPPLSTTRPNQLQPFDLTPGQHLSYVYLGKSMTFRSAGPRVVLVYEPLADHHDGCNVLFGDGRVEFIPKPVIEKVLVELQAGRNPPPSLR